MEHQVDLVVRRELVEQVAVHDIAGVAGGDEGAHRLGEGGEVQGDRVVAAVARQRLQERAPDLAVGPRHQHHRPRHAPHTSEKRRPTRVKASTARSTMSAVWAAESCTRIRDSPLGTTG